MAVFGMNCNGVEGGSAARIACKGSRIVSGGGCSSSESESFSVSTEVPLMSSSASSSKSRTFSRLVIPLL